MNNTTVEWYANPAINTLMTMLMVSIVPSVITSMMTAILGIIRTLLPDMFAYCKQQIWKINVVTIIDRQNYHNLSNQWHSEDYDNLRLIQAVTNFVRARNAIMNNMMCTTGRCQYIDIDDRNSKPIYYPIELRPNGVLKYSDYSISLTDNHDTPAGITDPKDNKNATLQRKTVLTISSAKSIAEISKFIELCHREYVDDNFQKSKSDKKHIFTQIPALTGVKFFKCPFVNTTRFASIFFPEKQRVIDLVNKVKDGKLDKLSLLLHGSPGCGKTSIIRALANLLGYTIVVLKLSCMNTDEDLITAFHNPVLMSYHCNDKSATATNYDTVNLMKRIYVLEDIDADSKIGFKRVDEEPTKKSGKGKSGKKSKKSDKSDESSDESEKKDHKPTLSGLLNALDGILAIRGVLVITTNHPEKLDPALIRYGRITMELKMQPMKTIDASALIQMHFPDSCGARDIIIGDDLITPATLEAMCKIASDVNDLREILRVKIGIAC